MSDVIIVELVYHLINEISVLFVFAQMSILDFMLKSVRNIRMISIDSNLTDLSSIPIIIIVFHKEVKGIFSQKFRVLHISMWNYQQY